MLILIGDWFPEANKLTDQKAVTVMPVTPAQPDGGCVQ